MTCNKLLQAEGKPYPRTCPDCGLGPCKGDSSAYDALVLREDPAALPTHGWHHGGETPTSADKPAPKATDITATLTERGSRYGKFTGHAAITQQLKIDITHALQKRGRALADDQQEALDMICHKIGRIVNGDPDYADSWVDIAGYAKLVADRLEGVER